MKRTARVLLGVSLPTLMMAGQAYAQDAAAPAAAPMPAATPTTAAPAPAAAPAAPANSAVGDIVVTANKREQKLNDVGTTVAVLSGAALQQRQVVSLADIATATPSLSFSNSANGTPIYTLRGVGFSESSLGAYPTVSTYLDEAPLPFPVLSSHSAFDLERVEVLKGPQGILFGQNATGGAINFIAAKPTNTFHAGGDVTYGRFNTVTAEGFVSGPITQDLTARLSGRIEHGDGWQVSNSTGDKNADTRNYMGRLILNYTPGDRFRLNLNVNGWKDKSQTQAPQYIASNTQAPPFADPAFLASPFSPEKPRAADWTPGLPHRNNWLWQAALRAEYDVTDSITLTSLTSYVSYKQRQGDDGDGLPIETLDLVHDDGRIKSFNQEVRLSNNSHSRFRWVVGGNYERSTVDQRVDLSFPQVSIRGYYNFLFGYPFHSLTYTNDQGMRNYAFFGNGEYDFGKLTLKLGARYTHTDTKINECSADFSGDPKNTGGLFYDVLLQGAFGPYKTGDCYPINNLPYTLNGVAPGSPGAFVDELKQHNYSWRAGLDYKPMPGILLYGNVAKGYKAGGFPTLSASLFSQYLPVTQESVLSFEGGVKASLFDRLLQLNVAGFYYDYRNKQLRSKFVDPNFGILDVLQNIPKSDVKGFEIEANLRPMKGLTINNTFTFLDAKIKRFTGINSAGVEANFAGAAVPFTPKYQLGSNLDYEFPLSERLNGFIGTSVNYRSKTVAAIGGDTNPPGAVPQDKKLFGIKGYALVDLRAGIAGPNDKWRVSVWGKNVFNKYYWNNVVAAFDTIDRYTGMPATYGVSLSFRY